MQKKKRILLVYYKLFKPGGLPRVFTNLANELVENGYDVDILLMMREQADFYPVHPKIKRHNIDTFSHWAWKICEFNIKYLKFIPKIRNINAYIYNIGVFLMLRNWMRKNHQNYDKIISSFYKLTSFLSLNKLVNYKTICWENVDYNIGGFLYKGLLRKYYRNINCIVCTNRQAVTYYEQFNKTYLITNMIGSPFEDHQEISIPQKENKITYVGRLDKEKNVIELLEIIKNTSISDQWLLQIIGDGPEIDNLQNFVKINFLAKKVTFLGVKSPEEIHHILLKSKIFAFTSLKEGLPTVLIEAMFCGNVLVSYDCNYGPSDIITEKNGFLIPLHDQKKFCEKLELLTSNSNLINDLMLSSFEESKAWKKNEILKKWNIIL